MRNLQKTMGSVALILISVGTIYYYRDSWADLLFPKNPCQSITYYSVGSFDKRFGISEEEFLKAVEKAEGLWEKQTGRELFSYSATGTLEINLVYDYRQEATDQLKEAGVSIGTDKAAYDSLRARYNSLNSTYDTKKKELEKDIDSYEDRKNAYEKKVSYWNDRGGAPPKEYSEMEQERKELNREVSNINREQDEINSLAEKISSTAVVLNSLANKLNMQVVAYNDVAENTGEEFSEGEYVSDKNGQRINVYQFESDTMLERLMSHEFGHALGLDHVENSQSIMYRLNQSENNGLTEEDVAEMNRICNAK